MGLFGEVSTILYTTLGTVQHPPALEEMSTPSESEEEEKITDIADKWKLVRRQSNGSGDTKKINQSLYGPIGQVDSKKEQGSCLKKGSPWCFVLWSGLQK